MSSAGQIVGGIVGAVVGFYLGGPSGAVYGAQIGMMAGGYIDPPEGQNTEGPRLDDLSFQTSTYGAKKTRAYGTAAVTGNVFWLEGDKYTEHKNDQQAGGKGGGGGATQTTYTYSATFAVSLTENQEITGIRRLWVGDRLIYDAGSDNIESILASNVRSEEWHIYTGSDTQEADPRMQADKGVDNVSSYPGRAYIVFYDLDLTEHYNNSLLSAQVKAEVVTAGIFTETSSLLVDINRPNPDLRAAQLVYVDFDGEFVRSGWFEYSSIDSAHNHFIVKSTHISGISTESSVLVSDFDSLSGHIYPEVQNHQETPAGLLLQKGSTGFLLEYAQIARGEAVIDLISGADDGTIIYEARFCVIDGDIAWTGSDASAQKLQRISLDSSLKTASSYTVQGLALTAEFLFAVNASGTSSTQMVIERFNRETMEWVEQITITGLNGLYPRFDIVDENDFIVLEHHGGIKRVVNWTVTDTLISSAFGWPFSTDYQIGQWFGMFGNMFWGCRGTLPALVSGVLNKVYISRMKIDKASAKLRDIVTHECGLAGLNSTDLDLSELVDSDVRGYLVTGVSSPRGALEPLQAAWPYDVYQKGYKVGFKTRGSASLATIHESDLGATDGGKSSDVLLPVMREMETQIARTVTVKHLDSDRDYEIGEQTAPERPGVSSVEPRQVNLPIVLTATEAAQMADVLNAKEWTERVKFGPFSLPPTYADIEPADVVTINHRNRSLMARMTRVEYLPDGRLICGAVLTASAAYSSSATGADPIVLGQSLVPMAGSSRVVLLDIPTIDSSQDALGIAAAMYGFSAGWPGGVLVRSDDQGQTWQTIQGFNSKVACFSASDTLGVGRTDIIDATSILTVTQDHDAADIFSITEGQLLAGGNLAAYGADGRWEIIGIKTVSLSGSVYTLTNFLRGRYGSEWAMTMHAAGDKVVMLTPTTAGFINLPSAAYASPRLWRAVTQGYPVSSAPDVTQTYIGNNLKPLAPVYLNGSRDPLTLDWSLTWTRRSRTPVEAFSGVATPLGEASESYDLELWDSGYTTLKRTFAGLTSAACSYTQAQQITDYGAAEATLYVKIYQNSATVGRGIPLVTSIYRSMSADPFGENVMLFAPFTTDFSDALGHAITASGAVISGGYALFDGVDDYVYLDGASDLAPGTSDFTWELRVTPLSLSRPIWLLDYRPTGTGDYIAWYINTTGYIALYVNGAEQIVSSAGLCSINVEYCVELCRSAGTTRLFVDGALIGSWADSTNYLTYSARPFIMGNGADPSNPVHRANAKIRWLRYTSAARYTSAHTPASLPLPDPT